jgi:cell division protein FtsN
VQPVTVAVSPTPAQILPAPLPETPATAAPGAGVRVWVVQLGSFASREHAQALQQQLSREGFLAQIAVTLVTGQMLYRVRTVPASDRAGAEELGARLNAAGHPGSVQRR